MKLSLVVPMYRVEAFLPRCLESLLAAGSPEGGTEILLVDDGSPDACAELGRKWAGEHPQIRVISQENKGLSGARNTGLAAASGTYVWFVDSDDALEAGASEKVLRHMESYALDVCQVGYTWCPDEGPERVDLPPNSPVEVQSGSDFFAAMHTYPTAWSYVHRRENLVRNGLWFKEGIIHEDEEFLPRLMRVSQRVGVLREPLYRYYQNKGGIMGTRNLRSALHKCEVMKTFQALLADASLPAGFRDRLRFRAFVLFQTILHPASMQAFPKEEQETVYRALKSSGFYPVPKPAWGGIKFRFYQVLMNLDLAWYVKIRSVLG